MHLIATGTRSPADLDARFLAPTTTEAPSPPATPLIETPAESGGVHEASRELCALVYTEQELRDDIDKHFTDRRYQSLAPCYSIDLVALLRHTRRANRLNNLRDWCLTTLLLAVMTLVSYVLFGRRLMGFAVVVLVVLAAAIARVVMVRREVTARDVFKRIVRYAKGQWRRSIRRTATATAVATVLTILVLTHPIGRLCLMVCIAGFLAAWLIVAGFSAFAFLLGSRARTGSDSLRHSAGALPTGIEDRAEGVSYGNLLVYTRDRASGPLGPFVGAGHRLSRWSAPLVDVTVGKRDDEGNCLVPKPVDVVDLHKRLKESVEDLKLPKLRCEHRLYVDGSSLTKPTAAAILLMNPPVGPPLTSVAEDIVLQRVAEPLDYERGYLCLQVTDWNGDVVVTMFVRAVLERELLYLECGAHALPEVIWHPADRDPLERYLRNGNRTAKEQRPTQVVPSPAAAVWHGVKTGTRAYWPTLFGATRRCGGAATRPVVRRFASWRHERERSRGGAFDFGADTSLREYLALGQDMHYNVFVDTLGHLERLQRRLAKSFAEYLTSCDIDLQDFVQRSATIINNIQQNIFNDLKAGAITFGNNSNASGSVIARPAPGGGAPAPRDP